MMWRNCLPRIGGYNHAFVVALRNSKPGPYLVRPSHDFGVAGLIAERERCLSGGLGFVSFSHVVLDTAKQQCEGSRKGKDFSVLGRR
jgi:hypothetical protein